MHIVKSLAFLNMDIFANVVSMNECSYIKCCIQGYIPSVAGEALAGKLKRKWQIFVVFQ